MNFFNRQLKLLIKDLVIEKSRVKFNIEKSLVGYPNKANIQIYDLQASSRQQIEEENIRVELYAGYENPPLLFSGDIINVLHQKQGVDWITILYCGDAIENINNSTINKTLRAGATTETIFNELVGSMEGVTKGITKGLTNCLTGKQSLLRGLQLTGNVKDWLKKISEEWGFDYSVNDGIIETTEKNKPLNDAPIFIINQKSGMIGSPERSDVGVNVKNYLLPELRLGRRFEIKSISEKINAGNLFFRKVPPIKNEGVYRIDKLIHVGDTHENTWETTINGRVFNVWSKNDFRNSNTNRYW